MTVACNCYALRQASRRVSQFYDQVLAPSGLRATQYMMLAEIDQLGPISLLPLAKHLIMDRATLGHNLRPLEAKGYVTRSVGADRRSRKVGLTEAGRTVLAEAKPLWRQAHALFEAEMGKEEAAQLRIMLGRVAESELTLKKVEARRGARARADAPPTCP
ncbi:MAG: winged helix-turn-helix transcriptional regulator [Acetobacteraceae bacterium]|nr:winged helix-turn-helix transcriptional regulator [Acetobacteraceae bacterium]